ncbi:chorismate mutase [Pacificimonas flava]|uniref:chorismate mutase n=3 Tax=Sphingosinicellaceae TaxID=2820280 RepID=A0A219BAB7_9SPHN|nr:chorismate mutase [Pacificimonas flava]MBZ6378754.1 chorismate mutase [Pacificimonas aurantium]OWV34749.1 chorismate mutase [Pacificimonas flava]
MAEIRDGIDELDRRIVALLGERMRYIEAAARVKQDRDVVRDEWRKADVIDKAAQAAEDHDFPPALVREIYEVLVEGSIAHEFVKFDQLGEAGE